MDFKIFQKLPITYGISQKPDGDMNRHIQVGSENRKKFFGNLGIDNSSVSLADLQHSNLVTKIEKPYGDVLVPATDGLVTNKPGIVLSVTVADCFPVYFYDPVQKAVGMSHSGWRGTVKNIVQSAIKLMVGDFKSDPKNILVGIGPGIRVCHFEIKEDIVGQFKNYEFAIERRDGEIFIALPKIITRQLLESGIKPENIEDCGECTYEKAEQYFSFRRDKPLETEAMMAYINAN